jgi:hypothetical protein
MARKVSLGNRGHIPYERWIPAKAVKFHRNGTTSIKTLRKANVAGYKDASGVFHPIRWDPEYDPEELSTSEGSVATDWAAPRGFFAGSKRRKRKATARKRTAKRRPKVKAKRRRR